MRAQVREASQTGLPWYYYRRPWRRFYVHDEFWGYLISIVGGLKRHGAAAVDSMGIYCPRPIRGGRRPSQHAYAAAADLAAVLIRGHWVEVSQWQDPWPDIVADFRHIKGLTVLARDNSPRLHADHVHVGIYPTRV